MLCSVITTRNTRDRTRFWPPTVHINSIWGCLFAGGLFVAVSSGISIWLDGRHWQSSFWSLDLLHNEGKSVSCVTSMRRMHCWMKIRFLPFYGVPFSLSFRSEQYWSCSVQWWVIVCGEMEEFLFI